jgi:hypothetical protein
MTLELHRLCLRRRKAKRGRYCRGQEYADYARTMATEANALGGYLRARRQQVQHTGVRP